MLIHLSTGVFRLQHLPAQDSFDFSTASGHPVDNHRVTTRKSLNEPALPRLVTSNCLRSGAGQRLWITEQEAR